MSKQHWEKRNGRHFRKDRFHQAEASSTPSLLAFGYSCKLFQDDAKACFIDQGRHLIPWMGESNLLIDRFDVRGHLQETELKKYESNYTNDEILYKKQWTEEESKLEAKCDLERYRDLPEQEAVEESFSQNNFNCDINENQSKEKEIKNTNSFSFDYDQLEPSKESTCCTVLLADEECDFEIPIGLHVPNNVICPRSMKMHRLIEKTARFIVKQGTQMEIILKAKQSTNPQFNFLRYDSDLNAYYKLLLNCIKEGNYISLDNKSDSINSELSDDEQEHYLHPSLVNSRKETTDFAQLPAFKSKGSAYSQLVNSLQAKIEPRESCIIFGKEVRYVKVNNDLKNEENVNESSSKSFVNETNEPFNQLEKPPPDVEVIIEKLAQYVSKSGEAFEQSVRERNETRFEFLKPENIYHPFYLQRRRFCMNERLQEKQADITSMEMKKAEEETYLSTMEKDRVKEQKVEKAIIFKSRKKSKVETDEKLKEKQEERKRKAAVFLNMIKSSKLSSSSETVEEPKKVLKKPKEDQKLNNDEEFEICIPKLQSSLPFVAPDSILTHRSPSPANKICKSGKNYRLKRSPSTDLSENCSPSFEKKKSPDKKSRHSPHRSSASSHRSKHESHERYRSRYSRRSPRRSRSPSRSRRSHSKSSSNHLKRSSNRRSRSPSHSRTKRDSRKYSFNHSPDSKSSKRSRD